MKKITISFLVVTACVIPATIHAQQIHVPSEQATIQEAIIVAEKGDTVVVADGTYYENINFLGKAITVASTFILDQDSVHIAATIIDGSQPFHSDTGSVVLMISGEDTTSVLKGFTITGGSGTIYDMGDDNGFRRAGGGVFILCSGGKLENNIIESNTIEDPGTFRSQGGGICALIYQSHSVIIRNNQIKNNKIVGPNTLGGGIAARSGRLVCEGNRIEGNAVHAQGLALGGGLFYKYDETYEGIINEVVIRDNFITLDTMFSAISLGGGGGLAITNAKDVETIQVYNNLICKNSARAGGGIMLWPGNGSYYNNTIVDNIHEEPGNTECNIAMAATKRRTVFYNNIIDNSISPEIADFKLFSTDKQEIYLVNNMISHPEGIADKTTAYHNFIESPDFQSGTYALAEHSPGIGWGLDSVEIQDSWFYAPGDDLEGNPRPNSVDTFVDMGAIESPYKYTPYFYLDENGITVKCKYCQPGDTGTVNGIRYEAVDRELLDQRIFEEADLTILCTSLVMEMDSLFLNKEIFNQNIGSWDVSNVTNMSYMFCESWNFNQDISTWDVSNVTNMSHTFCHSHFNQDISSWDVSNVRDMSYMFNLALSFNINISKWDVSEVTSMRYMFSGMHEVYGFMDNTVFNQDISNWDVSNVIDMDNMFSLSEFNQDISSWDVSNVTDMSAMFQYTPFNHNIGSWIVSNVTDMSSMFENTPFNHNIGSWDVSNVTDMSRMFNGSPFNQNIGSWDVSNVTVMDIMFSGSPFNREIGSWNVSNVINMNHMFYGSQFNKNISGWCVENIVSEPLEFALECPLQPEFYPVWGTCPPPDTVAPEVRFETDTLDLKNGTSVSVTSTEAGYVYLVTENTEKELMIIRNSCLLHDDSLRVEAEEITNLMLAEDFESGIFWVYARDEACNVSEPDTLVIINTTGIYQHLAEKFRIYPNPMNQTFTLELEDLIMGEIEIMNLNGQLILRRAIHSDQEPIDISQYPNGIYFVTVRSDTWVRTEKVVKY